MRLIGEIKKWCTMEQIPLLALVAFMVVGKTSLVQFANDSYVNSLRCVGGTTTTMLPHGCGPCCYSQLQTLHLEHEFP